MRSLSFSIISKDGQLVTTWEVRRIGLKWWVVKTTAFRVGGRRVQDLVHYEKSFWRYRAAEKYVEDAV